MKTYEVFLKKAGKDEFRHAGALNAPDEQLGLLLARDSYVRRGEGSHIWLVERDHIIVGDDELLAPNHDTPHRHNDGSQVAARRKRLRETVE